MVVLEVVLLFLPVVDLPVELAPMVVAAAEPSEVAAAPEDAAALSDDSAVFVVFAVLSVLEASLLVTDVPAISILVHIVSLCACMLNIDIPVEESSCRLSSPPISCAALTSPKDPSQGQLADIVVSRRAEERRCAGRILATCPE